MGNICTKQLSLNFSDDNSINHDIDLQESQLNKLLNIGVNMRVYSDMETTNEKAKNIYVAIGRRYIKTVQVTINGGTIFKYLQKPIINKSPLKNDILNLLELMNGDEMIVMTLAEALQFICILMTRHNTTPDFVEDGIHYFASPVIFEINENVGKNYNLNKKIEHSDINNYMFTSNIPLYTSCNGTNTLDVYENAFDKLMSSISEIYKCMITKTFVDKKNITRAYYINSKGTLKCINL